MLAYTGLETVANLAEETREPGRALPRSLFSGIGLVVLIYVAIACVALSAFPAEAARPSSAPTGCGSPLMGIVDALRGPLPDSLATVLRVYVGLTGAVILLVAVTTSISGFTRLAHSLGEHGQLPRAFGRLNRRTLVSPQAIVAAALISTALMIGTSFVHDDIAFLASLFSFGVLAAFTAAQLAVIKLRFSEPDLPRPYRAPWNVSCAASKCRCRRSSARSRHSRSGSTRWPRTPARATAAPPGWRPARSSTGSSARAVARACSSTSRPRPWCSRRASSPASSCR